MACLSPERRDAFQAVDALLHGFEVGESELEFDRLDVSEGVGRAVDVDHVFVVEAANHVHDRVGLPDISEKLVAEPLPLRRTLDEASDVDEFDRRRHDGLGVDQLVELAQPDVGDGDDPGIGLDRAEGIVLGLDPRGGERVEDRAFSDVGETDDAAGECHGRRILPNPSRRVMPRRSKASSSGGLEGWRACQETCPGRVDILVRQPFGSSGEKDEIQKVLI